MYLVDGTGATVAAYEYDPFGNILSATGEMAEINPLRYRGYYYDAELEMYYLQSRYYDPMVGRFINADDISQLGADGTALGYNLFAYCANNPINYKDPFGYGPVGTIVGALLGFGLGSLLVPWVADLLNLRGWGRRIFIGVGVAAIIGLGAYVGYYVGEAIFAVYKAGGAFAYKINQAIAKGIAKIIGASIEAASGNGWKIKIGKYMLRIMTEGGGRTNYFRLSHITKGAMTILGVFSNDRGATHIPITFENIIKIIQLLLRLK